jgi:hypothetical protein
MAQDITGWKKGNPIPSELTGEYYLYQGQTDIRCQVELGGKGQYRAGYDVILNYSKTNSASGVSRPTNTLEDPDGFEIIWDGTDLRATQRGTGGSARTMSSNLTKVRTANCSTRCPASISRQLWSRLSSTCRRGSTLIPDTSSAIAARLDEVTRL